jgi:hypothetical protein
MEIPMEIQEVLAVLDSRHEMDVEILSKHIQDNFSGSMLSLKQLKPLIVEIKRCFKRLPRKKSLDGTYPTIAGHRSFGAGKADKVGWCLGVLHKDDRTVRYMLAGGNVNRGSLKHRMETVSSLDIGLVMRYLTTKLGTLDRPKQEQLAKGLEQFVETLNVQLWKTRKRESR